MQLLTRVLVIVLVALVAIWLLGRLACDATLDFGNIHVCVKE